jgi:hypothetical protein
VKSVPRASVRGIFFALAGLSRAAFRGGSCCCDEAAARLLWRSRSDNRPLVGNASDQLRRVDVAQAVQRNAGKPDRIGRTAPYCVMMSSGFIGAPSIRSCATRPARRRNSRTPESEPAAIERARSLFGRPAMPAPPPYENCPSLRWHGSPSTRRRSERIPSQERPPPARRFRVGWVAAPQGP